MSAVDYIGAGTTLSSSYFMRNFYVANSNARTSSNRSEMRNSELSYADSTALRRAIRNLGNANYIEDQDPNIRNSVKAFINVYNNLLDSASGSGDYDLERSAKQLKSLTNEYASQLDKIGITVKSDGTLEARDSLFETAKLSKFENLFSKDSDYMQRATSNAKRVQRYSQALENNVLNQLVSKPGGNTSGIPGSGEPGDEEDRTEIAGLVADALDLDTLVGKGIGKNINIVL